MFNNFVSRDKELASVFLSEECSVGMSFIVSEASFSSSLQLLGVVLLTYNARVRAYYGLSHCRFSDTVLGNVYVSFVESAVKLAGKACGERSGT